MHVDCMGTLVHSVQAAGFLPFLPQDNEFLRDAASEAAVSQINADLAAALQLPAAGFWAMVQSDASLYTCVDSYLRYKR